MSICGQSGVKLFLKSESEKTTGDVMEDSFNSSTQESPMLEHGQPAINQVPHRDNGDGAEDDNSSESSRTSLIDENNQVQTSSFIRLTKCTVCVPVSALLSAALMIVLLSFGSTYLARKAVTQDSLSVLAHENDNILLESQVNAFYHSSVCVEQCGGMGDDHKASIYLQKSKNVITKEVQIHNSTEPHFQNLPSYKSGIIDYLYLIPQSYFTYVICLASATNYTQIVPYYLFAGMDNYIKYIDNPNYGKKLSALSVNLTARPNKKTSCTPISHSVESNTYYFMLINTPGNITYYYNFTLHKIEYDMTNTKITCNVSRSNSCLLKLSNPLLHTKYDILAHVYPYFGEDSITTTLCVTNTASTIVDIIGEGGVVSAGLVFILSIFFTVPIIVYCYRKIKEHRIKYGRY